MKNVNEILECCSIITFSNKEEWKRARIKGLSGTDASCILGLNKNKSNYRLWQEKMGLIKSEDLSDNERVRYGIEAEEYIRKLFILDYQHRYDVIEPPKNGF